MVYATINDNYHTARRGEEWWMIIRNVEYIEQVNCFLNFLNACCSISLILHWVNTVIAVIGNSLQVFVENLWWFGWYTRVGHFDPTSRKPYIHHNALGTKSAWLVKRLKFLWVYWAVLPLVGIRLLFPFLSFRLHFWYRYINY